MDDWTEFKEHNKRYSLETPSMKYVKLYMEQPSNGEGTWLQPKEILNLLVENKKVPREDQHKLSDVKIGEALHAQSFPYKSVRRPGGPRNCYYVKPLF
jgi:hypothetical protein